MLSLGNVFLVSLGNGILMMTVFALVVILLMAAVFMTMNSGKNS